MIRHPLFLAALMLLAWGCSNNTNRTAHHILPVKAYERLMVGNLEADFIGDENCLRKCHTHDKIGKNLRLSVHGDQIATETGLPLVNCESCHGPGSLAVVDAEEKKKCNTSTLLPLADFPAQAQSQLCLKCHSAASTPILINWNSSAHANGGVSCFDCHQLHKGPAQKVSREEQDELCFKCHQKVRMEFGQFSRHPLPEHKMSCSDCHDPHSSSNPSSLREVTAKATCTRCHMEFQGPFVYEHADLTEDCSNCHRPHGSPNDPLLQAAQPFLCLQCHAGHHGYRSPQGTLSSTAMKQAFFTRCTDCHSSIHGTDLPSAHGRGTFITR